MMDVEITKSLSSSLNDDITIVAEGILDLLKDTYPIDNEIKNESLPYLIELVQMVSVCLHNVEVGKTEAQTWGKKMGRLSVERGTATLDSTLEGITLYKKVIWTYISNKLSSQGQSNDLLDVLLDIDAIFNNMVSGFSSAFTEQSVKEMKLTEEKYLSISAPIVPILPGVGVLPLIGDIDERRARVLLDKTLITSKELRIEKLVIDLSGTFTVDEIVIDSINKLVNSLKIIGIEPVLTGIRSEISQQFIQNGKRFLNIPVYRNIMQVIQTIQR